MPLVTRKTESKTLNFGTVRAERTLYVPPGELRPGDRIVEPTKRQLAELAVRYPGEFGAEARAQGVGAPKGPAAAASHDVDPTEFSEAQEKFLTLSAKAAVAFLKGEDDEAVLGALHDAEQRREDGARKSVLNAFHAKGVGHE